MEGKRVQQSFYRLSLSGLMTLLPDLANCWLRSEGTAGEAGAGGGRAGVGSGTAGGCCCCSGGEPGLDDGGVLAGGDEGTLSSAVGVAMRAA